MAENIANTDLTLNHDADLATLNITTPPSTKTKADGSFIYKGPLSVSVTAAQKGTCGTAAGVVTINPTATKVKDGGSFVSRETDQGTGTVNGTLTVFPFSACSFPITVDIQDGGQDKAKAE